MPDASGVSGQVAAAAGGLRPRLGEQALLGLGQDSALDKPLELQAGVVDAFAKSGDRSTGVRPLLGLGL